MNLYMVLGTWMFAAYFRQYLASNWEAGSAIKYILVQFYLAMENVIASWYSSMLLLLVSLKSTLCFLTDRKQNLSRRERYLSWGWLGFAFAFALLSLDEIGSLHERIGMITAFNPSGDLPLGWVLVLAVPIGLVALFMVAFAWLHIRQSVLAFAFTITGVICFITVPFLELLELRIVATTQIEIFWQNQTASQMVEESLEIFGSLFFLIATNLYIIHSFRQDEGAISSEQESTSFSATLQTALIGASLLIGLLGLEALLVEWLVRNTVSGDAGIAKNWFPAALGMLVLLLCLQIWEAIPSRKIFHRLLYLLLGLFSLLLGMYYGANIYGYMSWEQMIVPGRWLHLSLLTIAVVLGIELTLQVKNLWSKVGIVAWVIFLGIGMKSGFIYVAHLVFIAFTCLLISLLLHLYRWQHLSESQAEILSFDNSEL
ncbi:hypothetical protein [Oscillatoria sp. FACHB-1406]|uniref:hypothetical protein n=1 Tax=Oscillatoria sp. FACHB-1406 TaxID=2692846 RepID=UPI0019967D82|nr:hypothetical protein [Oscillatoria sp. FACHB-1406]MBD2578571.1 hypothetical protein [Oscillatoria sp. FACHB-1406]